MILRKLGENLYQSEESAARWLFNDPTKPDRYHEYGLVGVINVAWNVRLVFPSDVRYLTLSIDDFEDVDPRVYDLAVRFYKVYRPCLIHCAAGQNRSVAFSAACLVADGMALDDALRTLASTYPHTRPQDKLVESLTRYTQKGANW